MCPQRFHAVRDHERGDVQAAERIVSDGLDTVLEDDLLQSAPALVPRKIVIEAVASFRISIVESVS